MADPAWFNTWPLASRLARTSRRRLEIGPGLHPRLPVRGTWFVDIAAPAVDALARAGGLARRGDLRALPYESERFDLVAAFDVIEHVPDGDAALDEIARVARTGATVIVSVPIHPEAWSRFDEAVGHFRRYEPDAFADALARRGIRVDRRAAFGMKPRSSLATAFGLYVLEHHAAMATRWYEAALPWIARAQRPLRFVRGMLDRPNVADLVVVGTKTRGAL